MNVINGAVTAIFNVLLTPLEAVGWMFSLIIVSGIFGVLALVIFKHISNQKGIKAAKDKIKGHMIEIRLYQDDLGQVAKSIGKVLLYNTKYIALNFGPFIPLMFPFALVAAQMVVRYGFDPVPIETQAGGLLAGEGITLKVEFDEDHKANAREVQILLPNGVEQVSKVARIPSKGIAVQELVATAPGTHAITIQVGETTEVKLLHAVDPAAEEPAARPRYMQPERTGSFLMSILWPAEDTVAEAGISRISFNNADIPTAYPERDFGWLPGSGPVGVLLWFVVFSMLFGVVALKPLGVQI